MATLYITRSINYISGFWLYGLFYFPFVGFNNYRHFGNFADGSNSFWKD